MSDAAEGYYSEYVAPLSERVARRLGFRRAYQERPEETAEFPSYMVSNIRIGVSILDRLRLLISGKMEVEIVTQTDVEVHHAKSQSNVGVTL